ncbi:exopolysaccharide biosynthesis polyprenyl glycosylphosphotransferase [Candidatus Parabeggiatoa sp. HSG14]|uniref:sugar transferase n=1 Tax=Candidatus Parabeggiatoa sp. HSG14 TaxID=3055593 RepID=UPI0025A8DD62|nr:exopolysaccharide biosynthesis polyprenyl glycosylphosphotransferase [Thiotrichales bacterium HSG14]
MQHNTIRNIITTSLQYGRFHWQRLLYFNARYSGSFIKRLFDIVVSAIFLILFALFILIIALLIIIDSPGPIFFCQTRVGKRGQLFKMWKFRSMSIDAEQHKAVLMKNNEMSGGVLFKMKNDPRMTHMGIFIRKFSIDELPQFWNVLWGDMSLVGPRPPLPSEVAKYDAYQRQRLEVKPGITCIWQVSGRSEIPFQQQVEMDLQYINTQSFFGDIKLLLKTVPAVLKCRGAF